MKKENKEFLKNRFSELILKHDKWVLNKGDYLTCHWNYYECFDNNDDTKIRFKIEPHCIISYTVEVYINDAFAYSFFILPFSTWSLEIIQLRYALKYNKNDEEKESVDEIVDKIRNRG